MVHPCCGSSLKQGTKFLAMLSMALSVLGTIASSFMLVVVAAANLKSDPNRKGDEGIEEDYLGPPEEDTCIDSIIPEPVMLLVVLVLFVLNLFLAIMLFIGAEQEDLRVCRFWWRVSLSLWLIDIIILTVSVAVCKANVTDLVINSAEILRSMYELWVVKAFIAELQTKETKPPCRVVVDTA